MKVLIWPGSFIFETSALNLKPLTLIDGLIHFEVFICSYDLQPVTKINSGFSI